MSEFELKIHLTVILWLTDSPSIYPPQPAQRHDNGEETRGKGVVRRGVSEPEGGQQQRFLPLRKDASRPREDALSLRSAAGDNVSDWVWDLRTHRSLACPEIKVVRAGRSSLLSVLQTDAIKC